jgi:hypothetical protein
MLYHDIINLSIGKLPPAARGILFEKTTPLDPPQKLFIKKAS